MSVSDRGGQPNTGTKSWNEPRLLTASLSSSTQETVCPEPVGSLLAWCLNIHGVVGFDLASGPDGKEFDGDASILGEWLVAFVLSSLDLQALVNQSLFTFLDSFEGKRRRCEAHCGLETIQTPVDLRGCLTVVVLIERVRLADCIAWLRGDPELASQLIDDVVLAKPLAPGEFTTLDRAVFDIMEPLCGSPQKYRGEQ